MTTSIVFLDTETTGLDERVAFPWEFAGFKCLVDSDSLTVVEVLDLQIPVPKRKMLTADPISLEICRFEERYKFKDLSHPLSVGESRLREIHAFLDGQIIAGNVIDFDARQLAAAFDYFGIDPIRPWHYHMIDVENVAAGSIQLLPPYKSEELSAALNADVDIARKHTACGDAWWALLMYANAMELKVHSEVEGEAE